MSARYGYDAVGRLTAVSGAIARELRLRRHREPALDRRRAPRSGAGIRRESSAPISSIASAIPSSTHWTLSFDENGRRTGKRRSDGAVVESYAYDAFGALRVLAVNGVLTVMGYDHEGRRVVETRDGLARRFFGRHAELVNGQLVKYYYVGDQLVATRSGEAAAMTPPAGEEVVRFAVSAPVRIAAICAGGAAAARAARAARGGRSACSSRGAGRSARACSC